MNHWFLLLLVCLIMSCASSKKSSETNSSMVQTIDECDELISMGYSIYRLHPPQISKNPEDSPFATIRFYCTKSSTYASYYMYNKFDRWDSIIMNNGEYQLKWTKAELIKDKFYRVYTYGQEKQYNTFTAFMIIDQEGMDVLSPAHPDHQNIVKSLVEGMKNIRQNDSFLEAFEAQIPLN